MLLNNIKFEVNITKLKYFLLLPLIFFSINLQSQAEASNWHFGYGAGLTFNLVTEQLLQTTMRNLQ